MRPYPRRRVSTARAAWVPRASCARRRLRAPHSCRRAALSPSSPATQSRTARRQVLDRGFAARAQAPGAPPCRDRARSPAPSPIGLTDSVRSQPQLALRTPARPASTRLRRPRPAIRRFRASTPRRNSRSGSDCSGRADCAASKGRSCNPGRRSGRPRRPAVTSRGAAPADPSTAAAQAVVRASSPDRVRNRCHPARNIRETQRGCHARSRHGQRNARRRTVARAQRPAQVQGRARTGGEQQGGAGATQP